MKIILLLSLLFFISLRCGACMCEYSEPNFYRNLSADKSVVLVVLDNLSIGNEYNERIEHGKFRLLDIIYDSGNISIADTLAVNGNDGANCGEYLGQFNEGDTLFLAIGASWIGDNQLNLDGCNTNFLKVENGKCKGLPMAEVLQKIDNSIGQTDSCGCGMFEFLYNFYTNVEKPYSFCFASFTGFDYGVEWDGRLYQTGYFTVLDTIGNFDLPINTSFVVLGENGIDCGERFERFNPGDSLILALARPPFETLSLDTFSLTGYYCGNHVLRIKNGKDNSGMSYSAVKAKMHSIITNKEEFKTNEGVRVYPNPFNSTVFISAINNEILGVRVFDIHGNLVLQDAGVNCQQKEYSLASMLIGIYQIEITTSNGMFTQKMIKAQ